jgi:hypothetical protein
MMRTGWQRIVAGAAVTAVAPLAVTLALGTAVQRFIDNNSWHHE